MAPFEALRTYPEYPLWRYQASGGRFSISNLNSRARARARTSEPPTPRAGCAGEEVPWLATVLTVARIGGHGTRPANPPPEEVVWFVTDPDGALVSFVEPR